MAGTHAPRPVPLYWSEDYTLLGHAFETTRKSAWITESLKTAPIAGLELVEPRPLTEREIGELHDRDYVRAIRTSLPRALAESQGLPWDEGLWPMVRASNGGAVAAAVAARTHPVAGSLSSGLHHAHRARGEGYCTFNGLALAAKAAGKAGAATTLIVDLDAHCGGGTHELLRDDARVWQLDVSVSDFDQYVPTERYTLDLITDASRYLPTVHSRLAAIEADGPRFELCIYNAGMDPHEGCGIDGLAGITTALLAQREAMVFEWCRRRGIPVAFVIAGGYTSERLDAQGIVALHRLTLDAAVRAAAAWPAG